MAGETLLGLFLDLGSPAAAELCAAVGYDWLLVDMEHGATTDFSSPLTAARTNTGPAWLEWLIFPHHVNYHIEHHLYASVPHYNLPALHREMAARGVLEGAELLPFRATLAKIFAERAAT